MGTEDAAVDVRLVDDHVAEIREHVPPAVVIREEPHVDHVRVGQDHIRPLADLQALFGRGVAVVDRGLEPRDLEGRQRAELVLRQRLGRVEIERAALGLPRQLVEHREVERERLPRRSAGRHEHVLAATRRIPHRPLVLVEPRHADRRPDARVELGRQLRVPRLALRLGGEVRQLLALQQPLPAQDVDAHTADASLGPPGCPAWG